MTEPHVCQETPGTGRCFVCGRRLGPARPLGRRHGGPEAAYEADLEATYDALGDHPDDDPDDVRLAVLNRSLKKRRRP